MCPKRRAELTLLTIGDTTAEGGGTIPRTKTVFVSIEFLAACSFNPGSSHLESNMVSLLVL